MNLNAYDNVKKELASTVIVLRIESLINSLGIKNFNII